MATQTSTASPVQTEKEQVPNFLVDGVNAVAIHNGVMRMQFMRLAVSGRAEAVVELSIPVSQMRSIGEAFTKVSKT
jgi:hypothetical protein